jgi:hypothetical protein
MMPILDLWSTLPEQLRYSLNLGTPLPSIHADIFPIDACQPFYYVFIALRRSHTVTRTT